MIRLGEYEISTLVSDRLSLDGGAMFGAVPKALWSKKIKADAQNRIPLATRLLVLRSSTRTIIVDVGLGRKWSEKEKEIYAIQNLTDGPLEEELTGVTDVILTHLHFDHAAGATRLNLEGELELAFPQAKHYLSEIHYAHAQQAGLREKGSFLASHMEPLKKANLQLTKNGDELFPGVYVHQSDGHTPGLHWVKVGDGPGAVVFPSDLVPTAHHLPVPWVMGYDLCAARSMEEKNELLQSAVKNEWIVVFEHDLDTPAATIREEQPGRYAVLEKVEL